MKILIIRLSSIGDIVLTTPVIRSLAKARPEVEIHYLTKSAYHPLLAYHPQIHRVHLLKDSMQEVLQELKGESFDFILDLHRNLRTWRIKRYLGVPAQSFDKKNREKYLLTRFKRRGVHIGHIVPRYGQTLASLGVTLDEGGLELFLGPDSEQQVGHILSEEGFASHIATAWAVVLGAKHATKRWLPEYFVSLINQRQLPVLLIGGPDAEEEARWILPQLQVPCLNAVGKYDLLTAAGLMKTCREVFTHDTGFMHIAAAFGQVVYSIWGNTVPELGMTPYHTPHQIFEIKDLACRPCSKIGFDQCPKGHFRCMRDQTPERILPRLQPPLDIGAR